MYPTHTGANILMGINGFTKIKLERIIEKYIKKKTSAAAEVFYFYRLMVGLKNLSGSFSTKVEKQQYFSNIT